MERALNVLRRMNSIKNILHYGKKKKPEKMNYINKTKKNVGNKKFELNILKLSRKAINNSNMKKTLLNT